MGRALTVAAIESIKPDAARREFPDGLVSGLYLVVQPSGNRSWALRYRPKVLDKKGKIVGYGKPCKHTLGAYPGINLKSARELAQRALVEVASGSNPAATKKAALRAEKSPSDRDLFEKVVDTFIERYAKANTRESSWRETERILKREAVPAWQGKRLKEIGRADVHEMLDGITDRGAAIMANRTLAAVRKLFSWAVDRGLVETSPCEKVKAPSAERSRDRVLSDAELKDVWLAADGIGWPFGPLFQLLILTGARRDEVGSMQWSEVDLDKRVWVIPRARAKNNVQHTVPLSDQAVAILASLPRINSSTFIFSTNGKTAVAGFSKAKERIDRVTPDMPAWTLHDLRRSTATGLARLGIPLPVIEKVLNHVSGSFAGIVGVYQLHSYEDEKRHALQAWGAFVERLVSSEAGKNVVAFAGRDG